MDTPVAILTEELYPYLSGKKVIMEISGKLTKRTKKMLTKWPKGGSFNKEICDQMLGVVKNHNARELRKKKAKTRTGNDCLKTVQRKKQLRERNTNKEKRSTK